MIAAFLVAGAVFLLWPTRLTLRRPRAGVAVLRALAAQDPRRAVAAGIGLAAALGLLVGGPVAAFLGAVYTGLGGRALLRHRSGRRAAADRSAALDDLAALAADLRAGLVTASIGPALTGPALPGPASIGPASTSSASIGPRSIGSASIGPASIGSASIGIASSAGGRTGAWPASVLTGRSAGWAATGRTGGVDISARGRFGGAAGWARGRFGGAAGSARGRFGGVGVADRGPLAARVEAVWRLAERTGAPAADLVERIEADARAADRAAASAAAQAAGAQATALLLAALPIGGIGLGIAIGADPVRVLLHTPLGAACAILAVLLQAAGLMWAERLAR